MTNLDAFERAVLWECHHGPAHRKACEIVAAARSLEIDAHDGRTAYLLADIAALEKLTAELRKLVQPDRPVTTEGGGENG